MSNIQQRSTRGGVLAGGEPPVRVSSVEVEKKFRQLQEKHPAKYGPPPDPKRKKRRPFWGIGLSH